MINITVRDSKELEIKTNQYKQDKYKITEDHTNYRILKKQNNGKIIYHVIIYIIGWVIFLFINYILFTYKYINFFLILYMGILTLIGFYNMIYLLMSRVDGNEVKIEIINNQPNRPRKTKAIHKSILQNKQFNIPENEIPRPEPQTKPPMPKKINTNNFSSNVGVSKNHNETSKNYTYKKEDINFTKNTNNQEINENNTKPSIINDKENTEIKKSDIKPHIIIDKKQNKKPKKTNKPHVIIDKPNTHTQQENNKPHIIIDKKQNKKPKDINEPHSLLKDDDDLELEPKPMKNKDIEKKSIPPEKVLKKEDMSINQIEEENKSMMDKTKYCVHCGAILDPGAKFCSDCGKEV